MEAQREQIFSEFIQLGVRSREPYRIQKRQNRLNYVDDLPADSQELLQRVRQPDIRRDIVNNQLILWLRTCYGPDSEPAWNTSHDEEMSRLLEEDMICNDESLYNFGLNWERIFLLRPEILETGRNVQKYEEETQSALSEVVESEANSSQGADDSLDPVEALDMDRDISFSYHRMRSLNRIHIVDATTLASDGPDAGKVLIVFFDELGQTVRYARDELDEAVEHTALTNIYLEDHLCWAYANIGELYQRGHPLGPPYSENFGGDS
ncbi:uncharacterized protein N7483_012448 [Penicillium malachiteum]|uniref:uncharacterized protein n=1 Tax=Penicillium malachiteum TaxID=1324776 RepID=UPI002547AAE3|nr:uncharacterized protein N7483_012448 [Penicillium malachiteum]KAJ5715267.1 hypothetical protein N7483_012448 [Penicillium malachiteum]